MAREADSWMAEIRMAGVIIEVYSLFSQGSVLLQPEIRFTISPMAKDQSRADRRKFRGADFMRETLANTTEDYHANLQSW